VEQHEIEPMTSPLQLHHHVTSQQTTFMPHYDK